MRPTPCRSKQCCQVIEIKVYVMNEKRSSIPRCKIIILINSESLGKIRTRRWKWLVYIMTLYSLTVFCVDQVVTAPTEGPVHSLTRLGAGE